MMTVPGAQVIKVRLRFLGRVKGHSVGKAVKLIASLDDQWLLAFPSEQQHFR
jgi:hypothetical protein